MPTKRLPDLKIHYITTYRNYISKIFDIIYDYMNTINEPKVIVEKTVVENADQLNNVIDQIMEKDLSVLHLYVGSKLLYRILEGREIDVKLLIITMDHYYLGCEEELIHELADILLNKYMGIGNVFIIYTNPEVKKNIGKYFETIENTVLPFISLEKELVTETLTMDPFTIIGVAKEYDVLKKYIRIVKSLNDLGVRSRTIVVTKSCTSDPYVFCIWNDYAIKALRDLTALILFKETYEAYMVLQRIAPRGHIIILPQNFTARSWFDKNELVIPVESIEPEDLADEIVINIINNSDKYKKLVASHVPETYRIDYFALNFIKTILPLLNK